MEFLSQVVSRRAAAALLAVVACAGCATVSTTPEAAVRARATQNWKVLLAGDLDGAYEFMPPSYRAVTPAATYKKGFGAAVQWVSAEVTSVKCETEDKCIANVKVEAKPVMMPNRRTPIPIVNYYDQVWVRENNQWWLFPTP
jgi:hypothetical protein